jgi:hypothetical protein
MNNDAIIKSFYQGIACAKAGELPAEEVYDSALNYACNDWNLRKAWLDDLLASHFAGVGYPEVW